MTISAAIDVGSNSVHLLVASLEGGRLVPLRDESTLLGLGDVVDREGRVPDADRAALQATLAQYVDRARDDGAARVTLIGTEPLRRASNAAEVTGGVEETLRVPLPVISPVDEGLLTLLGVTDGRPSPQPLLVFDIGGGSSECVLVEPGGGVVVHAMATGSARMTAAFVAHDPPTSDELADLLADSRRTAARLPSAAPGSAIGTGGTMTNLVRLVSAPPADRSLDHRRVLDVLGLTARLTSGEIVARYGVNRRRATQLSAGAALCLALLERYGLDAVRVSEASLRDGAIHAAATLGDRWLEGLAELAVGRRTMPTADAGVSITPGP